MFFLTSGFFSLFAILSLATHGTSALAVDHHHPSTDTPPAVPTFSRLFDAVIDLVPDANGQVTGGPFGQREFIGFLGGNCTDPHTGDVVANILPGLGGEFGIISSVTNALYTDVTLVLRFVDDGSIAYLSGQGVGKFGAQTDTAAVTYIRMETNSTTRQNLVTTPLLLSIEFPADLQTPETSGALFSLFVMGFASPFFSAQSVDRLLANTLTTSSSKQDYKSLAAIQASSSSSQLVDILISNVWPASITNFSSAPLPFPELRSIGAPPLDDVCKRLKPRYHFAASGGQPPAFWEREPFVWDDESGRALRFISLGAFGGPPPTSGKKQRWFYAFSIAPYAPEAPTSAPANSTRNPFAEIAARKRGFQQASEGENYIFGDVRQPGKRIRIENTGPPGKPPPGYKCRRCDSTEHFINDCPERQKPPEGYVCRLCNTAGHLVRDCPTKHAVGDTGGRKPKEGYVCRACGSEAHYLDDCPVANQRHPGGGDGERRGGKRGPPKEIGRDECWFCLSNPNLAKHLIVAIGEECYLTLPKGQIIPTQSFGGNNADVPGGGHILIVPITHYPTFNTIPSDLASPIIDETEKYKSSLRQLYAKYKHEPVFFEVARVSAKGGHAHVQVVPIPSRIKSKDVEEAFLSQGRSQGVDFDVGDDAQEALASCAGGRSGYFRVDLPDGKKLVHVMKPHVPFNLQFGRQVLVDLLGWPNRLDWKACGLTEDEEKADAQAFKTAFAPFTS
ncbi:hypothetical protein D9757_005128 [Collybiopsis confluens]|uniref:CCHC-type domain-containing protein n=1 Tax=Collybiopsis confluens TaxID=2823264 RepID=A0A8H5HTD6_9AGAR|nr:hypothetical protein D9757_005128 [Collybiopsis confluens]